MGSYILAVDQSTQGTKGLLFDRDGGLKARADRPHRQIVDSRGYVEHDPSEILRNTLAVCRDVIEKAGADPAEVEAFGISNQRETSVAFDRESGEPLGNAVVWQCARAAEISERHRPEAETIRQKTGLTLSPYFPASKLQWIMENEPKAKAAGSSLSFGTIDTWLLYHLTKEHVFKTDFSNASRTQLFNIKELCWDPELLHSFGLPEGSLPEVCSSDAVFGTTDLSGLLPRAVPVCGVLGDSHGALFGQDCRAEGQIKATYGTGSSVMMNIGDRAVFSDAGIVTSLAWGRQGKATYVFEGNLNYTGAVITWLKDELGLVVSAGDTGRLAEEANPEDRTYFIPAFTGLGSPYWDDKATAMFTGITRTTGRKELVKAAVECIAYQITDLVELMRQESGREIGELRVDGGPTGNAYLMQFQSDVAAARVRIPELQELSGQGAAYMAGIACGLYDEGKIFDHVRHSIYEPHMGEEERQRKREGWKAAVHQALAHK